jgi:NAD-dependent dihydropyrimidine dehydrogenase PreA subunit
LKTNLELDFPHLHVTKSTNHNIFIHSDIINPMPKPVIDYKKCQSCGKCMDACPVDVFKKQDKKIKVANPDDCIACRSCEAVCPHDAIKVED